MLRRDYKFVNKIQFAQTAFIDVGFYINHKIVEEFQVEDSDCFAKMILCKIKFACF